MKKFVLILLIALLCLPVLAFAACAEPADDPYDLSTKEIGYEIPVYPDCEFSYVLKREKFDPDAQEYIEKSHTIKITAFSVTLIEKNPVSEGDVLEDDYGYYVVKLHAEGSTDASLIGKTLWFQTVDAQGSSIVNENSSVIWDFEYSFSGNEVYYIFKSILCVG